MKSRSLYRIFTVLLIVTTLTCNVVMVTFLYRFFYGDLEVKEPRTLHRVASTLGSVGNLGYKDYQEIVAETDAFDALSATMVARGQSIYVGERVEWVDVAWTTANLYEMIGNDALVGGRFLSAADDSPGAAKVAVVNESTWERLRAGKPFAPGAQIYVKANPFEVVGVVSNAFPYLDSMDDVEVWIPARQNPESWQYETDDFQTYQVLARLDPSRRELAETQLDTALSDIDRRLGFSYSADLLSETEYRTRRDPGMYRLFLALLIVTGFLFVLGAVNQLLMLVARSVAVSSDLKIMIALGARAKHVLLRFAGGFAKLLTFALVGVGLCAVGLLQSYNAVWGSRFGIVPATRLLEPLPLTMLLALVLALTLLHLGFPVLLYAFRKDSLLVRDRGAGARFSVKSALSIAGVVIQIALVTCSLLGSGAFLRSLRREGEVRAGPYDDRIISAEIAFASKDVQYAPAFRARLDAIKAKLRELGGVEAIGASGSLPLHQGGWTRALIEGEPLEKFPEWIAFDFVTPGYFEAVGLRFEEGVNALPEDAAHWPHEKFIINRAYADKYFPGQEALGRRIRPWDGAQFSPVVGIVDNLPMTLDGTVKPCIYIPSYQDRFILHVRLADPALVKTHANVIADRVRSADPEAIVVNVDTIGTVWKDALAAPKLGFYILATLSVTGLALSLSGAFGYQTYMMLLREREFAIRHSLGQTTRAIYWGEVRRGLWLALGGLVLGVAAFFAGVRVFGGYFFDISMPALGAATIALALALAFFAVVAAASAASRRPKLAILTRE